MAVRHVTIDFSAAPTAQQSQKFMSLVLQNVTDFSSYSADPVLGAFFTAGKTITVNAVGDNMPVQIMTEVGVGTTTASTTLMIGNLYHTIGLTTAGAACKVVSSLTLGDYVEQSEARNVITPTAGTIASYISWTAPTRLVLRVSESYLAVAQYGPAASNAGSYWMTGFYAKHDDELVFIYRVDTYRVIAAPDVGERQAILPLVLYPKTRLSVDRPATCTLINNFGPVCTGSSMFSTTYFGAGEVSNNAVIPYVMRDTVNAIDVKPVFQFKMRDLNLGKTYDVSGIHNVLMTAYNKTTDYADNVTSGGTTYKAVGQFLFAS